MFLPAEPPTPHPPPKGSTSQNSTFSEHGHVAYQIIRNHKMQQHGSKCFARRTPPPPFLDAGPEQSLVLFLAHLSRRLMGELIVYQSLRRPSVRHPSVRQHFQTSSPLKPLGQLNSTFIWRLLRTRERKFVQMVLVT